MTAILVLRMQGKLRYNNERHPQFKLGISVVLDQDEWISALQPYLSDHLPFLEDNVL